MYAARFRLYLFLRVLALFPTPEHFFLYSGLVHHIQIDHISQWQYQLLEVGLTIRSRNRRARKLVTKAALKSLNHS